MLSICGAIFEAAHPADELNRLEARAAAPDFWKDQAEAQRVLQRRRRLEQDRELAASLRKRTDAVGIRRASARLAFVEALGHVEAAMKTPPLAAALERERTKLDTYKAA